MDTKKEINWITVLKGMTIILVGLNHVNFLDLSTGAKYVFIDTIRDVFQSFFMPTFFFVSGALLYYTKIERGLSVAKVYKDKFIRIGIPFLFCTCLGNLTQILFNAFVKHPHVVTWKSFFLSFFCFDDMPWPHRWFLSMLILMMAMYPLYLLILKNKYVTFLTFIALIAIVPFEFRGYSEFNWMCFFSLNRYLFSFFWGIIAFKYDWWRFLKLWYLVPILWAMYGVTYYLDSNFIPMLSILGIMAMVATSIQISHFMPKAFSSFRNYIFQIYLFGIAFQAFLELLVWKRLGCPDKFIIPFYIISVLIGIYMPVLMSKILEKIPVRSMRLCVGLK